MLFWCKSGKRIRSNKAPIYFSTRNDWLLIFSFYFHTSSFSCFFFFFFIRIANNTCVEHISTCFRCLHDFREFTTSILIGFVCTNSFYFFVTINSKTNHFSNCVCVLMCVCGCDSYSLFHLLMVWSNSFGYWLVNALLSIDTFQHKKNALCVCLLSIQNKIWSKCLASFSQLKYSK